MRTCTMTAFSTAVPMMMGRYATTNAPKSPNRERIVPERKTVATATKVQPLTSVAENVVKSGARSLPFHWDS
jgi:hypothetical protein